MHEAVKLLVFTDLDGTLISHANYEWTAAQPALALLNKIGAGVVLASSKTSPEIMVLRNRLGLQRWPAIVENGGGVLPPQDQTSEDQTAVNNEAYIRLRAVLDSVPHALRQHYRGFGDMDAAEISAITGLSLEAATMSAQRAFSEPGLWSSNNDNLHAFLEALYSQGVTARQGGRFLTLSFGQTKADQMATIIEAYRPRHTVALGDAPNDVEMLEAADCGVIIANPHGATVPKLAGESCGRITRTMRAGPDGWNLAMLDLIKRLDLA